MNTTLQNIQIPQILTDKNGDSIAIISADEYKYLLDAAEKGQEKSPLEVVLKRVEEKRRKNGIS